MAILRNKKELQILETCDKAFFTWEIKDFSYRKIAYDANVNLALINYYFQNKTQLFEEVYIFSIEKSINNFISILGITKTKLAYIQIKNCISILFEVRFKNFFIQNSIKEILADKQFIKFDDRKLEIFVYEQIKDILLTSMKNDEFKNLENPKMIHSLILGTINHLIRDYYQQNQINYINFNRNYSDFKKQYYNTFIKMLFLLLDFKEK